MDQDEDEQPLTWEPLPADADSAGRQTRKRRSVRLVFEFETNETATTAIPERVIAF